jgi:hypothetical protein
VNLKFCNAGSLGARTTENFETKVDRKASGVLISQTVGGWPLDALGKAAEPNVSLLTRQEREHTIDRFCANHVFEDASSEYRDLFKSGPFRVRIMHNTFPTPGALISGPCLSLQPMHEHNMLILSEYIVTYRIKLYIRPSMWALPDKGLLLGRTIEKGI